MSQGLVMLGGEEQGEHCANSLAAEDESLMGPLGSMAPPFPVRNQPHHPTPSTKTMQVPVSLSRKWEVRVS